MITAPHHSSFKKKFPALANRYHRYYLSLKLGPIMYAPDFHKLEAGGAKISELKKRGYISRRVSAMKA